LFQARSLLIRSLGHKCLKPATGKSVWIYNLEQLSGKEGTDFGWIDCAKGVAAEFEAEGIQVQGTDLEAESEIPLGGALAAAIGSAVPSLGFRIVWPTLPFIDRVAIAFVLCVVIGMLIFRLVVGRDD
jgi:hypothetical protein